MTNNKNAYPPKDRTGYEPNPSDLISHGDPLSSQTILPIPADDVGKTNILASTSTNNNDVKPNATILPSPVDDAVAVNNIVTAEFDYTESLLNDTYPD